MPEDLATISASEPELVSTSEAEQMYLITVARAVEAGSDGPVPVAAIATALEVSVPSANEMIRKLDTRGLLSYEPYHGVRLSEAGLGVAGQVLRTRRLWATFLADHLGFNPADADEQACHLEHATTSEAANRLAKFLGTPVTGPLGRPIPAATGPDDRHYDARLVDVAVGVAAEVVSIRATKRSAEFLAAEGIAVGSRLTVAASGASGLLIELGREAIHLNEDLAAAIEVRPDA
jgi:DtxR family Mn-dependent transcriptional regulator